MKFRIRFAEQIVGLFVLLALLALAALLMMMGINQRWFARDYRFVSHFNSGENLSTGMAVKFKGFKIGSVDSILLLDNNKVEINFHIYDTYYDKLTPNSVLELAISPIGIGGGGLLFHPGKGEGGTVPEGSLIPSLSSPEGLLLVAEGLVDIPNRSDAVSDILVKVGPTIESVQDTLNALEKLVLTMDDLVQGKNDAPLGSLLVQTDAIARNIEGITGSTNREIEQIIDDVATLTESLKDTTGLVTRILGAQGSIPKLLDDNEEIYQSIETILSSLSASAEEIEKLLLFTNRQQPRITTLLDETISAINEGQDVLTGVKNNPLLRGGIPETGPQPTTFGGYRDGGF
jgi:phospholipid/cholesterol/gamma-HCH transport system substrate-binding protein